MEEFCFTEAEEIGPTRLKLGDPTSAWWMEQPIKEKMRIKTVSTTRIDEIRYIPCQKGWIAIAFLLETYSSLNLWDMFW